MSLETFVLTFVSLVLGTLSQIFIGWPGSIWFWLAACCGFIVWICERKEYEQDAEEPATGPEVAD
jgi:hypothetical protein